jgi:hypothetical protein
VGKLISQIQNYPLSGGSVAYNNHLLLGNRYAIQKNHLKDYFKFLYEISGDIRFFNEAGENSNSWNDLLKKDLIFQVSRFLSIQTEEIYKFFIGLPQTNHFNSDVEISEDEYETLCYQKFQIIQHLFWYYKSFIETVSDENQKQIPSILKSDSVLKNFVQFESLLNETSVLINESNKKTVADFNGVVFYPVDASITESLHAYYNPANISGLQVLTAYSNDFDKIKAANEYAYSVFKSLLKTHQTFNFWATSKLNELVNSTTSHVPHTALIIAFSKMKMMFDARFNQLIQQHTGFVFNDVIQLKKQPALPDNAYVTIGLAKNINQYFLAKDTFFKAGKNSKGKTVYYKSVQDLVLNSAKISALKSSVRLYSQNQLISVTAANEASNAQWQVNNAWLPFNDICESFTGLGIESKIIESVKDKNTEIIFEFTFKNNLPSISSMEDKFVAKLVMEDNSEVELNITEVNVNKDISQNNKILTIKANVVSNLTIAVKKGINARIMLISPGKEEASDDLVQLYKYLLSEHIGKVKVKMSKQQFVPGNVKTSSASFGASVSFIAFGSQSLAGSSFSIAHPFLKFADKVNITLKWAEKLKEDIKVEIAGKSNTFTKNLSSTSINQFQNSNASSIRFRLAEDITYTKITKVANRNIESTLPRVLQVEEINIEADLEEDVYADEIILPLRYIEILRPNLFFAKSLFVPFAVKPKQKVELLKRHKDFRLKIKREYHNNRLEHLYPFGQVSLYQTIGLTFLPDYSKNGFSEYVADLFVGLTNINHGQTVSLLFEIAEETAAQSQEEAKISWHYLSNNEIKKIEPEKVTDTTLNFLQTGIVQLMLPDDATNNNTLVRGENTYWLIARCDNNYEVVANIKEIKTNAVSAIRVLDSENNETTISAAPGTIENIFPKTANIKTVEQSSPSRNGRETEDDKHYFWRSSQLLRHKQRAISQWDFEQIVLEKFPGVYKVKCLNHAKYNQVSEKIGARSAHTLISLLPYYKVNLSNPNFQPAISISKLVEIKAYLSKKTSVFNQLQVVNTSWDAIKIEVGAMLNKEILDILFYRQQLDTDLKKFISPWAFEQQSVQMFNRQKLFIAELIDFIDELPYIHHIISLKIYKNDIEQFDEIAPTTEIHLLTSAPEHVINVVEYAD